jgi:hypothetical protein
VRTIIGCAHPLEKSAPGFEMQVYIAYFRGIDVLRTSALRCSKWMVSPSIPTKRQCSHFELVKKGAFE